MPFAGSTCLAYGYTPVFFNKSTIANRSSGSWA